MTQEGPRNSHRKMTVLCALSRSHEMVGNEGKPLLRMAFTDFWQTFDYREFWIYKLLGEIFQITIDPENPELVIFCEYSVSYLKYRCHKIFYSHENVELNKRLCDFSFTFRGKDQKHVFFSNLMEDEYFQQVRAGTYQPPLEAMRKVEKTKFCNFIYSNGRPQERIRFCQRLNHYRKVDCPGKVLNNHPPLPAFNLNRSGKVDFLKDYKFTIAFENESAINYTTEKIFHPLAAGSIPIYWGNPRVEELFNPACFINCHNYKTFDEVIELVRAIDEDAELFKAYTSAPPILPNSPLSQFSEDYLRDRIQSIANDLTISKPVSSQTTYHFHALVAFLKYKIKNRIAYTWECVEEGVTRREAQRNSNVSS